MLVLFPVVTLVSYLFIGRESGSAHVTEVIRASLLAFPTWLVFMGVTYVLVKRVDVVVALAAASVAWGLAALVAVRLIR